MRKYSVQEIDTMRRAVWMLHRTDKPYGEEVLRTYMINGTEPDELVEAAKIAHDERVLASHQRYASSYVPRKSLQELLDEAQGKQ